MFLKSHSFHFKMNGLYFILLSRFFFFKKSCLSPFWDMFKLWKVYFHTDLYEKSSVVIDKTIHMYIESHDLFNKSRERNILYLRERNRMDAHLQCILFVESDCYVLRFGRNIFESDRVLTIWQRRMRRMATSEEENCGIEGGFNWIGWSWIAQE